MLTKNAVPLVNNKNKRYFVLSENLVQHIKQRDTTWHFQIRKLLRDLVNYIFGDKSNHFINTLSLTQKAHHINVYHIVLVKVFLKISIGGYLILAEHFLRITAFAIVGSKHIRSHRFAEASWSANTYKSLLGIYQFIGILNKFTLIHINF